jgi:hypothetical protein
MHLSLGNLALAKGPHATVMITDISRKSMWKVTSAVSASGFNSLKHSGNMQGLHTVKFNSSAFVQKLYLWFHVIHRINGDYFPKQH